MRKGTIKIHFVDKGSGPPAVHILYWGVYALHSLYVRFRGLSSCNFHFHICGDGVVPGSAGAMSSRGRARQVGEHGVMMELFLVTLEWRGMRSERVHNAGSVPPLPGETCPEHLAYLSGALTTVDVQCSWISFFWGGDKQNKVLIKNVFSLDIYYIQRTFTKQWNKCYTCTIPT